MKSSVVVALVMLTAACSSGTNNTDDSAPPPVNAHVQELHEKVMTYHDEVMPGMGEIYSLQTALEAAADTMESRQDTLRQVAAQLKKADEAMMAWMRQFNSQLSAEDTTAAISYYTEQLEKVKLMRDQVVDALENGRAMKSAIGSQD